MKVKICANTSIEDAQMCIDAGADIIGILVGQEHASNDFVDRDKAKEICEFVNNRCDVSLVTHLTDANEIIKLTEYIKNNIIQLHSDIEETEVEKIKNKFPNIQLVRIIHVSNDGTVCTNYKNMRYVDYYLLDSFNLQTNQVGGTGITHDWNKSRELINKLDKPTFLAGGLNPDNVNIAIKVTAPYGVDVNSGCKNENGKKDREKVNLFVKNAKQINKMKIMFESKNIYFIEINKNLINNYLEMVNHEEVSKFISLKDRSFSYKQEINWLKNKLNNKNIIFSMVEKWSNKFIGNIELLEINNKTGELAICITPLMQNKGYGYEAIRRFIIYCFEELELENIELSVYSHNEKAISLYKKLGFEEYKRDVNIGVYNNKNIDDIYMRLDIQ